VESDAARSSLLDQADFSAPGEEHHSYSTSIICSGPATLSASGISIVLSELVSLHDSLTQPNISMIKVSHRAFKLQNLTRSIVTQWPTRVSSMPASSSPSFQIRCVTPLRPKIIDLRTLIFRMDPTTVTLTYFDTILLAGQDAEIT
jgi:hypothetical protein